MSRAYDWGKEGEKLAYDYLVQSGFKILEKNYRYGHKEVDLIARRDKTLIFVEVKSASTKKFGDPQSWINLKKQNQLREAALAYIQEKNPVCQEFRFDVIAIQREKNKIKIEHIPGAFTG